MRIYRLILPAKYAGTFDPSKPDAPDNVAIFPSPVKGILENPEGS